MALPAASAAATGEVMPIGTSCAEGWSSSSNEKMLPRRFRGTETDMRGERGRGPGDSAGLDGDDAPDHRPRAPASKKAPVFARVRRVVCA